MSNYSYKGTVEVNGRKKIVYKKKGSKKSYVMHKKRHISLTKYRQIQANKNKK
jgi:hypothetical protein